MQINPWGNRNQFFFQHFTFLRCYKHNCKFDFCYKNARAFEKERSAINEETKINSSKRKNRTCPKSSFRLSSQNFRFQNNSKSSRFKILNEFKVTIYWSFSPQGLIKFLESRKLRRSARKDDLRCEMSDDVFDDAAEKKTRTKLNYKIYNENVASSTPIRKNVRRRSDTDALPKLKLKSKKRCFEESDDVDERKPKLTQAEMESVSFLFTESYKLAVHLILVKNGWAKRS